MALHQSILFLFLLSNISVANWINHPDIRSGFQTILPSSSTFTSASIPISINVTFTSTPLAPLTGVKNAVANIVGFTTTVSSTFSLNLTLTSFTTTSLMITLSVAGDTSLSMQTINYIAFGPSVDFAEISTNCLLCANLNTGIGYREETRTGTSTFLGKGTLIVQTFLSGFIMNNSFGLNNYLNTSATVSSNSTIINYLFTTNENNTVTSICYNTLIFCETCALIKYYNYGKISTFAFDSSTTTLAISDPFNIGTNNPSYNLAVNQNRRFFGISWFNVSRAMERRFGFNSEIDLTTFSDIEYNYNYGTFSIGVSYFFIAQRACSGGLTWFNTDPTVLNCINNCIAPDKRSDTDNYCTSKCYYTCGNCTVSAYNKCENCEPADFRVQLGTGTTFQCPCSSGYVDIGEKKCYPCSSYIPGCDTCLNTQLCSTCQTGYTLTSRGVCQCTVGHLVSNSCTNITGCIELTNYGGYIQCTACNTTLNFQPKNFGCECSSGYYLSSLQFCLPQCGDGKQTTDEGCDDNNLISGDGCDSTCAVESGWVCFNGTSFTKSNCFINSSFTLAIKYIRRYTNSNTMQLAMSITPMVSQLSSISLEKNLLHNIPAETFSSSYSNGIISLEFPYNKTIENLEFYINLTLDNTVFYNTTLQTNFVANGMNAQLTYDLYNQVNYPLEIILIIYSVLAILVAFGSVLSEKMIGIEMIQTIQIVLFAQSVMKSTPSSFSPLQILRYASGFNEVQGRDFSRVYTFSNSLSSLGLEKEFLLSYNLMYGIMIGIGCLCLFFKLKQYYLGKEVEKFMDITNQTKSEQKFNETTIIYNYLFERIFFVSVFICMYLIIFAIMLQMTSMSSEYTLISNEFNLLCAFIAISILITMICGVILNGFFPNILLFPMLMKQAYPPIYFIYQCAFIFVLAFNYTQEYTLYVLEIMSIIFLLYIIAHRPYPEKVHTFVLILHQIFIICVIGIYIFENLSNPTENEILYKIFDFAIIIALFLILFLNAYRIYAFYTFLKEKNWDQYGNEIELNYENMEGTMDYRQLASPSAFKTREPLQQTISDENSKSKTKKRKKTDDLEMDEISKKKDKNKKGNQDLSEIKWKQYTLNDEDLGPNSSRFEATDRNPQPDSSRNFDKSMNRENPNEKNSKLKKDNIKVIEEEKEIKNISSEDKRKGRILGENTEVKNKDGDDEEIENPYDENGYSKKKIKQNEDEYEETRRKLKFDFNSKFK